jgi:hypothetical protein
VVSFELVEFEGSEASHYKSSLGIMLPCSLHLHFSSQGRKVIKVSSTRDFIARFFTDGKVEGSRMPSASIEQNDKSGTNSGGSDSSTNTSMKTAAKAKKVKFTPFIKQVDNLDSKASIAAFFESLGDPPASKRKSNMPPTKRKPPTNTGSSGSLAGRSIFDAFPIPDSPLVTDSNAFDTESYQQYRDMIDKILDDDQYQRKRTKRPFKEEFLSPIREWLQAPERRVEYMSRLPLFQASTEYGLDSRLNNAERKGRTTSFRDELAAQREAFLKKVPLSDKQYEQATVALKVIGMRCAKQARSLPLEVAWEKVKEAGICFDKSALNSFLYSCSLYVTRRKTDGLFSSFTGYSVLDMLGSGPSHTAKTKCKVENNDKDEYMVNLPEEVATFHDLLYEPTEESATIRIKALVATGKAGEAEALLNSFSPKREEPRQRTYLPILRCYLEQDDISSGLRLFKHMRESPLCILESETYVQLLSALAERGYFSNDSVPIEGAEELGYSSCGPKLFDELVQGMAEDVLEITSASARRLYSAFENALREQNTGKEVPDMHPLAPLPIENDHAADNELIVSRTLVANDTGVCPRSRAKLRLINLEPEERTETFRTLLKLAETAYREWNEKWGRETNDRALVALGEFATWLDTREGEPFTTFIDGPNVGYFMQNFDQGKFNIHQVNFMLNALEKMGENVLVIMPQKYALQSFNTSAGGRQYLDKDEMAIVEKLAKAGKLYRVPQGCLDDFYWMLASLSDQKTSRGDRNMDVEPEDGSGRWPGTRPMLVSNDQMRDHKLELLAPRLFRRWYSCHLVNYNFTAFVNEECVDREISFSTADFFSREIQGNPTTNSDGTDGGVAWHFPVSDWDMHERLCIRIPNKVSR